MMTEENNWVVHQSFRTTEAEDELIRQKMKVFGIRKKSFSSVCGIQKHFLR